MGSEGGKFGGRVGREQEESQQGLAPHCGHEERGGPLDSSGGRCLGHWETGQELAVFLSP